MRTPRLLPVAIAGLLVVAACTPIPGGGSRGATTTTTPAPRRPAAGYGVMVGAANLSDPTLVGLLSRALHRAGARWIRMNAHVGQALGDYQAFLDARFDLVLTVSNRDPSNAVTTYGTPDQWPHSGFPYRSRATYVRSVARLVGSLHPPRGRHLWVQCENEVSDASVNPQSRYWRGTGDQYLRLLDACHDAVKSVDRRIPVVLSGMASRALDAARDPNSPLHDYATSGLGRMLRDGAYDAVDLHFYGCVGDIAAKAAWVEARMHRGSRWISTENGGPDSRCPTTRISWRDDLAAFERVQAQQVPARLRACAGAGGTVCLWFSFLDLKHEDDVFNHLGLLDSRVYPPRKKPAYYAFRDFVT